MKGNLQGKRKKSLAGLLGVIMVVALIIPVGTMTVLADPVLRKIKAL
jgi:hypothetical protein